MRIINKIYNLLFGEYKYVKTAFHMEQVVGEAMKNL